MNPWTPLIRYGAYAALLGLLVWGIRHWGYADGAAAVQGRWDAQNAATGAQARWANVQGNVASNEIQTVVVTKIVTIKEQARAVQAAIPDFVSPNDRVPGSYGLLYNATVSGDPVPPRPAPGGDGSYYPLADFAATDLANVAACREKDAVIAGWNDFYARLKKLYPSPKPDPPPSP